MRERARLSAILVIFSLLATSASLRASEQHVLRFFAAGVWSEPLDDSPARLDGQVATLELAGAGGWEAGVEWRISPLLGVEASLARVTHDVDFGGALLGEAALEPIFLSLNFHLAERGRWDWWVAPTLVLFEWQDEGFRRGVEVDGKRDDTIGVTVGCDVAWNETWALTLAARYFDAQIRFGGGGEVAVDTLSLRAGAAARF